MELGSKKTEQTGSVAVATGSPTIIVDPSVLQPARYMFFGAPALSARYERLYQLQLDAWKRGDDGEVNRLGKNIDWLVNKYAKIEKARKAC